MALGNPEVIKSHSSQDRPGLTPHGLRNTSQGTHAQRGLGWRRGASEGQGRVQGWAMGVRRSGQGPPKEVTKLAPEPRDGEETTSASGEGWPGAEGATSAKALWSELTWPRQNSEAWKPWTTEPAFWSQDSLSPVAFSGIQGPLVFVATLPTRMTPGGGSPQLGRARAGVAPPASPPSLHSPLRCSSTTSPARKSRLPNEVPRALKELQGLLL